MGYECLQYFNRKFGWYLRDYFKIIKVNFTLRDYTSKCLCISTTVSTG